MWEVGLIEGFETIDYLEEQDIQNVLDAIDAIKGTVIEMRRKCANAERKAKAMEDKNWKDKQLQSLRRDLQETREDMFRGFPITQEQERAVASWQKEHDTKVHNNPSQYHGTSGGGYSYVFYPTGIGTLLIAYVIYASVIISRSTAKTGTAPARNLAEFSSSKAHNEVSTDDSHS